MKRFVKNSLFALGGFVVGAIVSYRITSKIVGMYHSSNEDDIEYVKTPNDHINIIAEEDDLIHSDEDDEIDVSIDPIPHEYRTPDVMFGDVDITDDSVWHRSVE